MTLEKSDDFKVILNDTTNGHVTFVSQDVVKNIHVSIFFNKDEINYFDTC